MIKILVIGSGAREHAIIKSLNKSKKEKEIYCLASNNNPGISDICNELKIVDINNSEIIKNYSINIDETSLGYKFPAFIFISLEKQQSKNFDKFEKKILNFPEVVECWLMTGAKDYLIRIAVKDVEEFEEFLTKKLTVIDGVSSVETSIPLRRVKSEYSRVE